MSFSRMFMAQAGKIIERLDSAAIDEMASRLAAVRDTGGRLFVLGVGGSAANAGHAVNDFRKLCSFETYAPTDNVSELTARTNDEGWETVFAAWLDGSRVNDKDAILVFSVGGGNAEADVSMNIVHALDLAKARGAAVFSIVGRDGGHAGKVSDIAILIPTVDAALVTPYAEAFQGVIWHCLVSHPALKTMATKW